MCKHHTTFLLLELTTGFVHFGQLLKELSTHRHTDRTAKVIGHQKVVLRYLGVYEQNALRQLTCNPTCMIAHTGHVL